MLKDSDGNKLRQVPISEQQWKNMLRATQSGIIRKLNVARKMLDIDKELSAGIYLYAFEEFGKVLVLRDSKVVDGKCTINYKWEFTSHPEKFERAAKYLQANGYGDCLVLGGGFDPSGYDPQGFIIAMLADFNSRLSVFYADFDKDGNILELPAVDLDALGKAINTLEIATNKLS